MGRLDTKYKKSYAMPVSLNVIWAIWTITVIIAAVCYVPPAQGFANPEAARLVILHVPCAMLAVIGYIISTIYAIAYLAKGQSDKDIKSVVSARLGFVFTVLATITGMVFAKIEWGAAWNWDPRETTILMLMLVYGAYFALRSAINNSTVRARISAVYNILACLIMPYLVFVLPRILGGLHPTQILSSQGGLSAEYRIVMAASAISMLWLYVWIFRVSVERLSGAYRK